MASRLEIAKHFEMNAATVGNAVSRLIDAGIVYEDTESSKTTNGSGRPQVMLRIKPDSFYFIGLNFSSESLVGAITDFVGNCIVSTEVEMSNTKEKVLKGIYTCISDLLEIAGAKGVKISGVGIGVPGVSDTSSGICITYDRIKGWKNVPLAEIIESMFELPTFIDHNSNCFALGELTCGDAQGFDNILSVIIRTGVAMGIVKNKEILNLSHISSGELGHITLNPSGKKCWCGNKGCLESYISGWQFQKKLKRNKIDWDGKGFDLNDAKIKDILVEMFEYLGIAIANVCLIFRPEAVVISGMFNSAAPLMKETVSRNIRGLEENSLDDIKMIISSQKEEIGAVGAALMAISRLYKPS